MKNKILFGLIATVVMVGLVGCGKQTVVTPDVESEVIESEVESEIEDEEDTDEKNTKPMGIPLTALPESSTLPIEEYNGVVKGYATHGFIAVGNEDIGFTVLPNNDYGTTVKVAEGKYEVTDREGKKLTVTLDGFEKDTYDFLEVAEFYCGQYENEDGFDAVEIEEGESEIHCNYYMEYNKDGVFYQTYFVNHKDIIQIVTIATTDGASLDYSQTVFNLYETVDDAFDELEEKFDGEVFTDDELIEEDITENNESETVEEVEE